MQILLSMLATCINDPEYVHVYHPVGKAWQCMYRANHNYGCFENKRVHECMSLELTLFLVYIILHVLHVGTSLSIYIYTTTIQCKLPECKYSICASGWMKKHHQRKLHRVNHHVCKWTICASGCRIKHHQRKLQLVTTTICASGMVAPVERRETP